MNERKYTLRKLFLLIVVSASVIGVQARLYPGMPPLGPTDQFPSNFFAFVPPVDSALPVSGDAPQIAEWTRQSQPNDTMILTGYLFSSYTNTAMGESGYTIGLQADATDDYIDTGIAISSSISIEVDGVWDGYGSGWTERGHGSLSFLLGGNGSGFGFTYGTTSVHPVTVNDNLRNTLYMDRTKYGVNGTYSSWTPTGTPSGTIKLLVPDGGHYFYGLTIFRATIRNIDTDTTLFDATVRKDGTFYDSISGNVFLNGGTGLLADVLQGRQVPNVDGAEGRDSQFLVYGQDNVSSNLSSASIQRLNGSEVIVTLPDSLPEKQLYLIWPRNDSGYGKPVAINKTQGWHVLPQYLDQGESFSVYGRNLIVDKDNPTNHIYCVEKDEWLTTTNANPYKADYEVPAGWGNGTYTLWPHNGSGREYGWGDPVTIVIDSVMDFSEGTTHNVKIDHGAVGDGIANDTASIVAALNASAPGDTVYFPAGAYAIDEILPTLYDIRLLGDGMDLTTITSHSTFSGEFEYAALVHSLYRTKFEDLTFDAGLYKTDSSVLMMPSAAETSNRLLCEGVRFTMENAPIMDSGSKLLELAHLDDVTFRNCEFITGKSLFHASSTNILYEGCNFYGMLDNPLFVVTWGGQNISMTDCTAQNLDNSDPRSWKGWSKGRIFHGGGVWGPMKNTYFGNCTSHDFTPRKPVAWVASSPQAVSSASFTFTASELAVVDDHIPNKYARIISGIGANDLEYNPIESINKITGVVVLEDNWIATPDTSSTIEIIDPINNRNTGEQWMFEFTDTKFRDKPSSATANTVVFTSLAKNYDGLVVLVVDGKGIGQSRVVSGNSSSGTVTVSEPWNVIPDGTSLIMIGTYVYRGAVYGNYLDGTPMAVEDDDHVATEGVSTYGGSVEICVEDNVFHELRYGISAWGLSTKESDSHNGTYICRPNFFNHYVDNIFDGCRVGVRSLTKTYSPIITDRTMYGHVYRNSIFTNTFDTVFFYDTETSNTYGTVIYDQNKVGGFSKFVANDEGFDYLENQIWVGNEIRAEGQGGLYVSASHLPVYFGNNFVDFHAELTGELPGPVLEVPNRYVEVGEGAHGIELYNSGSGSLTWHASVFPSDSWVSLGDTDGTISGGQSGLVHINADTPTGTPDDVILTISDGYQSKQITITYNASAASGSDHWDLTTFPLHNFGGKRVLVKVYKTNSEIPQTYGPMSGSESVALSLSSSWKMVVFYEETSPGVWDPVITNWAGGAVSN